jgi:GxxExxY protein
MEQVKSFAIHVFKTLGAGFSERVYHNAMVVLLEKNNICFLSEQTIPVMFEGTEVGRVRSDLVINEKIVVELKACSSMTDKHLTQCQMYMKLTKIPQGLVINFPSSDDEEVDFGEITETTCCQRCGRDSHSAQTCYASKHIKGMRLT